MDRVSCACIWFEYSVLYYLPYLLYWIQTWYFTFIISNKLRTREIFENVTVCVWVRFAAHTTSNIKYCSRSIRLQRAAIELIRFECLSLFWNKFRLPVSYILAVHLNNFNRSLVIWSQLINQCFVQILLLQLLILLLEQTEKTKI